MTRSTLHRSEPTSIGEAPTEGSEKSDKSSDHRSLAALDRVDELNDLNYQARGIVALIMVVAEADADVPDDAIPGACMALNEMLKRMSALQGDL